MRRISILILLAIACVSAYAQQITEQQALEKAQAFMKGKQFKSSAKARSLSRARSKAADKESMYVFNVENKGGFVIVSGDERTEPILGYSTSGEIDYDNMPDNLRTWLEGYESQIKAISENPKLARKKTGSEKAAIEPMIQTNWGQGSPYNEMCPEYEGIKSVTGCVATALAQVMYYHKWPASSTSIPAYTTTTRELVMEELPATTFDWDKMKLAYEYDDTGESADAVAKLMLYCGQAMLMDYARDDGSATTIMPSFMEKYFSYSPNMKRLFRNDYTTSMWENMLYEELSSGRPVIYSGNLSENGSGHEFICDGYDGAGLFHINWGWDGHSDGFFSFSVAFVDETSDSNDYLFNQQAVFGVEPSKNVEKVYPRVLLTQQVGSTYSQRMRNATDEDFDDVRVTGTVDAWYLSNAPSEFSFEIGWGLYNGDVLEKVLDNKTVTTGTDMTQYEFNNFATLSFGANLENTERRLYPIYKFPDSDEWKLCEGSAVNYISASIISTSVNLKATNSTSQNYIVNSITVPDDAEAGSEVTFTVNITNRGETMNETLYLWIEKDLVWKDVATAAGYVGPGETGDVKMRYVPEDGGTYKVKVTNDHFGNNLYGAAEFTVQIKYETISYKINDVEFSEGLAVGEQAEMYVNFTNDSQKAKQTMYLWNSPQGDDEWYEINSWSGYVEPGQSYTAKLSFYPDKTGDYYLRITTDSGGNDVKGSWTVSVGSYEDYVVDGLKYSCNKVDYTAKVVSNESMDVSQGIDIPETIIAGGEEYTVTAIGENAFSLGYYREDYDQIPFITFPKTLKSIGKYAFQDCGLSNYQFGEYHKIVIPEGVVSIGESAFHQLSGLYVLELPSTLKTIGPRAFYNNSHLKLIISHLKEPMAITNEVFFCSDYGGSADLVVDAGTKGLYQQAEGWKEYPFHIIEGEVQQIDGLTYALDNSSATASVIAGDCTGMKRIVVPSKVSHNGDYTVDAIGCGAIPFIGIDYLELPASIKAIRPSAFFRSSIHKAVSYMENPPKYESTIADTLFVPVGSKEKYLANWVFEENSLIFEGEYKERVVDGLKYWCATGEDFAHVIRGDYADMEDVVIPPAVDIDGKLYTVTVIENHAFAEYRNIHTVSFPNTIDSIGRSAFELTGLESLTLPSSLKTLGSRAFAFCQELKTIDLPEGLVTIMDQAFNGCISLEEVELPSTITCIEGDAFRLYHGLKKITSHIVNPFPISEYTFMMRIEDIEEVGYKWMESTILYVPIGSLEKYKTTEGWKNFTTIYEGEPREVKIDDLTYWYLTGTNTVKVSDWDHKHDFDFDTVEIPEKVTIGEQEFTVTEIADNAFSYSINLTNLVLPSTLKVIGVNAFYDNGIREVVIPEGVTTVNDGAFNGSNHLEKVVLPSSLTTIGSYAFRNPNKEKAMVICNLTEPIAIGDESFDFDVSTLYVGQGLKEAFMNAEGWKLFSEITDRAPDEIKETIIDGLKFTYKTASKTATIVKGDYKEMTSVTIPPSITVGGETYTVKSIANGAFYECENLTAVNISDLSAWCNMTMESNPLEYAHHLYLDGKEIKDLVIPDDVTYVGKGTFKGCTGLTSLTIPKNVKAVGENAFYGCYEVYDITLSEGLENIEPYAFYSCYPDELVIPEGVKSIGDRAFNGSSLPTIKHLELPSTLTSIGEYAFFMISSFNRLATVVSHIQEPFEITESMFGPKNVIIVPEGCSEAYLATKGWNNVLDVLEGDMSIDKVGSLNYLHSTLSDNAIVWEGDYQYVRTVTIPSSVTIGGNTYTVNKMGSGLFGGNNNITKVNLPSTIETIPAEAFTYCYGLKSIIIPMGVKRIEESAFDNCIELTHVELPSSLEYLGKDAFEGCQNLSEVVSHSHKPFPFDYHVFPIYYQWDYDKNEYVLFSPKLYVPFGTADIYKSTNGWDDFEPIEEMDEVLYDVNCDDVLDAKDVVDIIKFIAGLNPDNVTIDSADVNQDGKVDVADVIVVSQALLNKKK